MKKLLIMFLFIAAAMVEAKVCSRGCFAHYNGMAYGYAWNVSAGTPCAGGPAFGSTVYWAEVDPGWYCTSCGPVIVDQGVFYNYQGGVMAC